LAAALVLTGAATAEESFAKRVGDVKAADLKPGPVYKVPFLTWGGDVATFLANGGDKETKPGTLFAKQGLKVNLVNGDDFIAQVKSYLSGETPYLRGTMSMLGQASEVLGKDPRTKPVVFLQLTWSAGDHLVGRANTKDAKGNLDLKGKKVALQWGGPHVGFFDDILKLASLKWSDVKVVWTDDVTGDKGPAALFRKDPSIDACFAITPDMVDLTGGGFEPNSTRSKIGDGSEKSVKGARVIATTLELSNSIADVYAVRKDFYDKNKDTIEKFTAAYLKASEDLVEMRLNREDKDKDKALAEKYKAVLKMTQDIYGKETIPDFEAAHGLIMDANFVALPGNHRFFTDAKDLTNFTNRMKAAVDMGVGQGYAGQRIELVAADLDYTKLKKLGELKLDLSKPSARDDKFAKVGEDTVFDFDKDTIYFFTVNFDPDDANFNIAKYEAEFKKAISDAAIAGNAVFKIRGHVDPTRTIRLFVQGGLQKGIITREKVADGWKYYTRDGKTFNLNDTKKVLEMIDKEDFTGVEESPKGTLEAAQRLSDARAKRVLEEMVSYATKNGVRLTVGQFKTEGVGIKEPIIPVPKDQDQAAKNRRVEFRILRVSPEKLKTSDFDN
jgi:ABC-type nitrate/sulfonate/bicarbonate transport system substrate-binding protein